MDLAERLSKQFSALNILVKEYTSRDERRPTTSQRAIRHTPPPLHPDQVSELVAAFEAGVEVKQLAAIYGINRSTVQDHLRRREVRRRRTKLSGADIEKVVGLYAQGWTIEAIGSELRVGASTVRRALLKAGAEIRPRGPTI